MSSEEVFLNHVDWNRIEIEQKNNAQAIVRKLNKFFFNMLEKNDGYFSYKFIKDIKLRSYIIKSMKHSDEKVVEYAQYINGKNMLILDDTISTGTSISEAFRNITETFTPSSITAVTLFSRI
jgi:hypoxanthine-guanine phosphoribosyltransferase